MFLLGDAVGCAVTGQKVPDGYYHLDRMIEFAARHGAEVGCCGTCMDARGIADERLVNGARRSTLDEFTDWTMQADKSSPSDRNRRAHWRRAVRATPPPRSARPQP